MAKFKMLGLRRRTTTVKSHMPGQPPVTSLDGIELVLEYIPEGVVITPEEEKKVVENVKVFNEAKADKIFLDLDALQCTTEIEPEISSAETSADVNTFVEEAAKWKTKYEEAESKRRGLQLKVNEYKGKLAKLEGTDSASELETTKSGKGKGKARA